VVLTMQGKTSFVVCMAAAEECPLPKTKTPCSPIEISRKVPTQPGVCLPTFSVSVGSSVCCVLMIINTSESFSTLP